MQGQSSTPQATGPAIFDRRFARNLWRLTRVYWTSSDAPRGGLLLTLAIGLELGTVFGNVMLADGQRRIFDALQEEGLAPAALQPVHAPIGLDIGAITPQEIAVSIVAELIAVKHGKTAEPTVAAMSMRWEGALKR